MLDSDRHTRRVFLARAGGVAAAMAGWEMGHVPPAFARRRRHGSWPAAEWRLVASPGASLTRFHDAALRSSVAEVRTAADGDEARLVLERTRPFSLRNRILRLWIKVDAQSASDIVSVVVKAGSGRRPFSQLAYEEVLSPGGASGATRAYLRSTIKPGEWVPLTLGPPSFVGSSSAAEVDYLRLQDFAIGVSAVRGSRARLSFGGMELIEGDRHYPTGVVSFTFDDGLASVYRNAFPVLAARSFPGTAYVIRDLIQPQFEDSYMTMSDLHTLTRAGWEVAAHANLVADHNAYLGFVGVPRNQLIADVEDEVAWLQASGFTGSRDIALPQGYFDADVLDVLRTYGHFATVRTTDFHSIETLPVADPYRLRCLSYDPTVPIGPPDLAGSIMWRIDQLAAFGGWLILAFHDVTTPGGASAPPVADEATAISQADFEQIVAHVQGRGVPVRTVGQVWGSRPGRA